MIERTSTTYRAVVGLATVLAMAVLALMLLDRPAVGQDPSNARGAGEMTFESHQLGGRSYGAQQLGDHAFGARVLGAERPAVPTAKEATYATFRGLWTGHTRSLKIRKGHVARERISIGCCEQVADLTFEVRRVRGTQRHATLRAEVTRVRSFDGEALGRPAPEVGDVVRLVLDRGILTEPASGTFYCNEKRGMAGDCGA